jgi:uncharacterized membrane protein YuzA (DUF378 family)
LANLILLPHFQSNLIESMFGAFGLATLIGYSVMGTLMGAIFLWVYNPIATVEEPVEDDATGVSDRELIAKQ